MAAVSMPPTSFPILGAASVIMPISLDHQPHLGDSVELIAAEKAGIMKRKCPVVIGKQEYDAALDVLISTAERLGCLTAAFGQDFMAHEEYGRLVYQDEFGLADLPLPRLPGPPPICQRRSRHPRRQGRGFTVTEAMMEKAMASVEWPGRLQKLSDGNLMVSAPRVPRYGSMAATIPVPARSSPKPWPISRKSSRVSLFPIIGMINTKDPIGYFNAFKGLAEKVYCVPIRGSDAMIDPVISANAAYDAGLVAEPMSTVGEALEAIGDTAFEREQPPRILIGGSLYLVGDVLADKYFNEKPASTGLLSPSNVLNDRAALEIQLERAVFGAAPRQP